MFTRLIQFAVSAVLCSLLAAQPVLGQAFPAQTASAATAPAPRETINVPLSTSTRGVELHFVLLDSVSSATGVKGQPVRFAVTQDVVVNGVVLIPRGTPANGVVSRVQKGVPGKHNGYVTVEPREIPLANHASVKLVRNPPGEDDCGDVGPCAGLAAFVVIASPIVAAILIIESPFLIAHAVKEPRHHKLTPAVSTGEDMILQPCRSESAYIRSKIKSPGLLGPAQLPVSQPILAELDQCKVRRNHDPAPGLSPVGE